MTSNDLVVLNSILGKIGAQFGSMEENELFSLFSCEQVLKDFDLSDEELRDGCIDGGGDGGIDGFFAFINGELLREDVADTTFGKNPHFDLYLIQAKSGTSFAETAMQKINSTVNNVLSLSIDLTGFEEKYNDQLLEKAGQFRKAYLGLADRHPTLSVSLSYVTKGESEQVHPNVRSEAETFKKTVDSFFSGATSTVEFWGARELLDRSRIQPTFTLQLPFMTSYLTTGENDYVVLSKLADYYRFVTDENGNLRRYIFESNVRDYQGTVEVNKEIRQSLRNSDNLDFWWLNNGITILASKASVASKTITLDNVRIVNGLQTTTEIHNFLRSRARENADEARAILIRIIVLQDDLAQDRIIKATNFQTAVSHASLRATDKIQRDIEDYFLNNGLYYDRRKNYYKNQGKPRGAIVGIQYLAQSVMAIVLQRPDDARARPTTLIKNDSDYSKIFDPNRHPSCYLVCVRILLLIEDGLKQVLPAGPETPGFKQNFRFHIAMVLVIRLLDGIDYTSADISAIDIKDVDIPLIRRALVSVVTYVNSFTEEKDERMSADRIAKNREFVEYLLSAVSDDRGGIKY